MVAFSSGYAGYTPFGEQLGVAKQNGYGYNAEDYDAATGMLNLRARQYEPAMNRFSQKDIVRGQVTTPLSQNRYAYCANSPIMHIDPSGESVLNAIGNWWNKAKQTTVGSFINKVVVQPVKSAAKAAKAVVSPIVNVVTKAWNNTVPIIAQMWQEMAAVDESRPTCKVERQIIQERACASLAGDAKRANELSMLLANISKYTANEWRFLVSDIFSENNPASEDYIDIGIRMAILDRLKENGGFISPEELVEVGLYSANTTALTKQMGSGFIEMSYRLTQQGDSFWSMNLQVEEQRTGQLYSLINYMAFLYVSDYNDAFRSSGNAIRMDGATVAAPGYESVASDFSNFCFENEMTARSLTYNGDGSWTSKGGLIYGQGSKDGNRVNHVMQHTVPNSSKPRHTVFNVDRTKIIDLLDEAWGKRGEPLGNDPGAYLIDMERPIGTNGETMIKIIVVPGTNQIITAYPQ